MQIAGGPIAEFECDSNVVACPRLYPGRASGRARRRIVRRHGGRKYSNPSRGAEIRIRIDVSSDTCLRIENCYAGPKRSGKCAARVDKGKNIQTQHEPDVTRVTFIVRRLNE